MVTGNIRIVSSLLISSLGQCIAYISARTITLALKSHKPQSAAVITRPVAPPWYYCHGGGVANVLPQKKTLVTAPPRPALHTSTFYHFCWPQSTECHVSHTTKPAGSSIRRFTSRCFASFQRTAKYDKFDSWEICHVWLIQSSPLVMQQDPF